MTLKKIRSKIWTWKNQGTKKQGHCYSKRLLLFFLNTNDLDFFSGSQIDPGFQNKNSGCRLTGRLTKSPILPKCKVQYWYFCKILSCLKIALVLAKANALVIMVLAWLRTHKLKKFFTYYQLNSFNTVTSRKINAISLDTLSRWGAERKKNLPVEGLHKIIGLLSK